MTNVFTRLFAAALLLCAFTFAAQAQLEVVWGNNPDSEFDGGLNGWTTEGASATDPFPDGDPDAVFVWEADGRADLGNFSGAGDPIASPSVDNGAVVFDSDFYDNDGMDDNFGGGIAPADQTGLLRSPSIDLSAETAVSVQFNQYTRNFQSEYFIRYSNDGGNSWIDTLQFNENVTVNTATEVDDVIYLPLPGAGGTDNFVMEFIYQANYYFWIIDDVQIVRTPARDLNLSYFFYPLGSAVTPESQISTDTFGFEAAVTNRGANIATGATIIAEVVNVDTDEVLFSTSGTLGDIAPGQSDTLTSTEFDAFFPPELVVGTYSVRYTAVNADGDDEFPSDNSVEEFFVVSEDLFAKQIGGANAGFRPGGGGDYAIANYYRTGDFVDSYTATSANFEFSFDDGPVNAETTVYLWEVDFDEFFDNPNDDPFGTDPAGLTTQGIVVYDLSGADDEQVQTTGLFTDFVTFEENGVPLTPNTDYLLGIQWAGEANTVFQGFNTDINYYQVSTLVYTSQWFGGGFGPDVSAVLELNLEVEVLDNVNNVLPEAAFDVMPNPASDVIFAEVALDAPAKANITLADYTGRVIDIHSYQALANGRYEFDTSKLAAGSYILRLATEEGTKTRKFVVVR